MLTTLIVAAITAIVTASGSYAIARRKTSGKIDTTEAGTLWQESQQMRKELRDEVMTLRQGLSEANKIITSQQEELTKAYDKIRILETQAKDLQERIG